MSKIKSAPIKSLQDLGSLAEVLKAKGELKTPPVQPAPAAEKLIKAVNIGESVPAVAEAERVRKFRYSETEVENKLTGERHMVVTKHRTVYDRKVVQVPNHAQNNPNWPEMKGAGKVFPDMRPKPETRIKSAGGGNYKPETGYERRDEIRIPAHLFTVVEGEGGFKIRHRTTGKMTTVKPEEIGIVTKVLFDLFRRDKAE